MTQLKLKIFKKQKSTKGVKQSRKTLSAGKLPPPNARLHENAPVTALIHPRHRQSPLFISRRSANSQRASAILQIAPSPTCLEPSPAARDLDPWRCSRCAILRKSILLPEASFPSSSSRSSTLCGVHIRDEEQKNVYRRRFERSRPRRRSQKSSMGEGAEEEAQGDAETLDAIEVCEPMRSCDIEVSRGVPAIWFLPWVFCW